MGSFRHPRSFQPLELEISIMSMKQPGRSLRPVILSGIETTIGSAKQCSANKSSTTRAPIGSSSTHSMRRCWGICLRPRSRRSEAFRKVGLIPLSVAWTLVYIVMYPRKTDWHFLPDK